MSSSRLKYIKLMATVGIFLLFLNTQLIKTQTPANYSPQVRPLVEREETRSAHCSLILQELVELDMKERRELLGSVCSKYGRRLKVPLKLYNKKLRSVVDRLFI